MAGSVYWVGQDGNVYLKSQSGPDGQWSTRNVGQPVNLQPQGADTTDFSFAATRIVDPVNPPAEKNTVAQDTRLPNQQNIDLVNNAFNAKIAGFQGQLGVLDAQDQASQARIGQQYTNKSNDLQSNLAVGNRNLDTSRNTVEEKRARSLQDIRDRLQSQAMGYANQLGTFGAGDSSAANQINIALSGMASKNRGNVMTNASEQLTEINTKQSDLKREYERNVRDLDIWKQQTLSDLATSIMQKKQEIKQAIGQADAEKAQQLAQYDASYTRQAIQSLQNLQNQYASAAEELKSRFMNSMAPQNISISPQLQQYAVKPISAGELRNIGQVAPVNPEAEAVAMMRKREEEQANSILNPSL